MLLLTCRHGLIDSPHEPCHITQTEQSSDKTVWIKGFEVLKMLTRAQEHDGTLSGSDCTEGATTLGVAIELRDDHRAHTDGLLEGLGLGEASLADRAIHDEDASVRIDSLLYLNHLLKEGTLLSMTTGGVHDDDLVLVLAEVRDTSFGDFDRVSLVLVTVERTLDLCSVHLQLRERSSTECISAHNTNLPAFLHVVICELGASRRLTGTLQTNEHDHIRFASFELVCLIIRREHIGELINHCLLDDFAQLSG